MTASALLLGKPNGLVRPSPSTSASDGSRVLGIGQGPLQAFLPGVARWLAGLSRMRGNFTQPDKLYTT